MTDNNNNEPTEDKSTDSSEQLAAAYEDAKGDLDDLQENGNLVEGSSELRARERTIVTQYAKRSGRAIENGASEGDADWYANELLDKTDSVKKNQVNSWVKEGREKEKEETQATELIEQEAEHTGTDPSDINDYKKLNESHQEFIDSIGLETEFKTNSFPKNFEKEYALSRLIQLVSKEIDEIPEDSPPMKMYMAEDDIALKFAKRGAELVVHGLHGGALDTAFNAVINGEKSFKDVNKSALTEYATERQEQIRTGAGDEQRIRPFHEQDGRWGWNGVKSGGFDEWTSFTIEPKSFLRTEDSTHVRMVVHPADDTEAPYSVTTSMSTFNEPKEFREKVCHGRTVTADVSHEDLSKIKQWVGHGCQWDVPERKGVTEIGVFHDNKGRAELVTPNGTLGLPGAKARDESEEDSEIEWLDNPTHEYVKKGIEAESMWKVGPDTGGDSDREKVREIVETIPDIRDSDRLMPVLGWFYATPLTPLIREWIGEIPMVNITGDTGVGKSMTEETFGGMFGMGTNAVGVTDMTPTALRNCLSATNAIPLVFDEYRPNSMTEYKKNALHNKLRFATRKATDVRGQQDFSDRSWVLQSPVAIAGEQRIQGPAHQRRSLMTTFRRYNDYPNTEYADAHNQLLEPDTELDVHALEYWKYVLGQYQDPDGLKALWESSRTLVESVLADLNGEAAKITGLPKNALVMMTFGWKLYRGFATEIQADPEELPGEGIMCSAIEYAATEHAEDSQTSHTDTFLEVLTSATLHRYLEPETHFTIVNYETSKPTELRFKTDAFDRVRKYAGDYYSDIDLLSKSDLQTRLREAAEQDDGIVTVYSQNTSRIGRAHGIDIQKADATIEGFDPEPFYSPDRRPMESESEKHRADDIRRG